MRRTGGLSEVPPYLKQAEEACDKPKDPGLCYCQGLYDWYSGNPNTALRFFNNARQDSEWGQQALYNMIEICLYPDDEMVGNETFDMDDSEYRDSRTMALQTGEFIQNNLYKYSYLYQSYLQLNLKSVIPIYLYSPSRYSFTNVSAFVITTNTFNFYTIYNYK